MVAVFRSRLAVGRRPGAPQPRERPLLWSELLARRRFVVTLEPLEVVRADSQLDAALADVGHLLRRDVARPPEEPGGHRQAVEDVVRRVADGLLDLADLGPVGRLDRPPPLDQ